MSAAPRETPFLATAAEVRAILAGTQTQFRRPVKVCRKDSNGVFRGGWPIIPVTYGPREGVPGRPPLGSRYVVYLLPDMGLAWRPYGGSPDVPWPAERIGEVCPFGGPGERLWVRETWASVGDDGERWIDYRATPRLDASVKRAAAWDHAPDDAEAIRWRSSMHMPREASRITLQIVGVKIERILKISETDARANGYGSAFGPGMFSRAFDSYWDEVYGDRSPWHLNPWSWAVDFQVIA